MMINFRQLFAFTAMYAICTLSIFADEADVESSKLEDIYLNPNAVHVILEPMHRATLSSQITSPIVSIQKRMGDSFKEGDVLVKLDDVIYRANLKKALATYKQAELTLKTREELFQADVGSLVELREAQTQFASAASDMAVARKQLEATNIIAPYAGRIVDVYVHDFELAEALEPMMDIIGDDILLARMIVDSVLLNRIHIGRTIMVYFPDADLTVPAEIIRIGAEIDPASSTIRVDAKLENAEYRLTSGMSGMAVLPTIKNDQLREEPIEEVIPTPTPIVEEPDITQINIHAPEFQVEYDLSEEEYLEIMRELNLGEGAGN
jgi:RND family efflux transporter MFP subunit